LIIEPDRYARPSRPANKPRAKSEADRQSPLGG
jgi:hypothetical protein